MKKSDLENGMVVETRGREVYLLVGDILMSQSGYNELSDYDEDLLCEEAPFFDIMTVYAPARYLDEVFAIGNLPILWSREWRPQQSDVYYTPAFNERNLYIRTYWGGFDSDLEREDRGLVFKTKDEAIECANKMLEAIKEDR